MPAPGLFVAARYPSGRAQMQHLIRGFFRPPGRAPCGDSPTPLGNSPTPSGDSPAPSGDSPTPSGDSPTPSGDSPTPSGDSPTPSGHFHTPSGTPERCPGTSKWGLGTPERRLGVRKEPDFGPKPSKPPISASPPRVLAILDHFRTPCHAVVLRRRARHSALRIPHSALGRPLTARPPRRTLWLGYEWRGFTIQNWE
jgi:hypothetical protein